VVEDATLDLKIKGLNPAPFTERENGKCDIYSTSFKFKEIKILETKFIKLFFFFFQEINFPSIQKAFQVLIVPMVSCRTVVIFNETH
jgi:hypothetical protein